MKGTMSTTDLEDKARVEHQRDITRQWLLAMLDKHHFANPTDMARVADVAPSTLLRFIGDRKNKHSLSWTTIRKVSEGLQETIPPELMQAHGITRIAVDEMPGAIDPPGPRGIAPNTIPVKRIRLRPDIGISSDSLVKEAPRRVARPTPLHGDSTAFAFPMPDESLLPTVPPNTMMFATRTRELAKGEIAVLTLSDGREIVRAVKDVDEDGVKIWDHNAINGFRGIPLSDVAAVAIVRVMERP